VVLVEWDISGVTYADGFLLERKYSSQDDSGFVVVANVPASQASVNDSVNPGPAMLVYRVRAYNVTGYSAYSEAMGVFVP
jgi:hypothetical protein